MRRVCCHLNTHKVTMIMRTGQRKGTCNKISKATARRLPILWRTQSCTIPPATCVDEPSAPPKTNQLRQTLPATELPLKLIAVWQNAARLVLGYKSATVLPCLTGPAKESNT